MKKILTIIAAVLLPLAVFAGNGATVKGSPEFGMLESLAKAGIITLDAGKETLTRQEVSDLVITATDTLLSEDGEPSVEQLETAFMLLMEFETDIMEKGIRLSEVQRKMVDLKVRKERIMLKEVKDRQDLLFGMIGVKINGEAAGFMTDLVLYGNSVGPSARYTPITQYIDMKFTASSGSLLKAEAVFRLQNVFGGSWGAQDIYGVKRFSISGDFPVYFKLGDYHAKLTPFTIWANDDERPYEAGIYRDKREMNKKELNLGNNSWPVTGGSIGYKTEVFGASLKADALVARLEEAGKSNYLVSKGFNQTIDVLFPYDYDQYLWAGRVETDGTLKEMLKIGGTFVEIRDIKNTGYDSDAPTLDNYVVSADAEIRLFNIVKASGEFAVSNYYVENKVSPLSWQNRHIRDSALRTRIEAEYFDTKAEAEFFVVGNSYTAYAAQSRIYNTQANYPYLTQNNTWNVAQQSPYYIIAGKIYPFTRYNKTIFTNYYPVGFNMMPQAMFENNAAPSGSGTPNRQGINARLSGSYLDGMIMPSVKFMYSSEIVSYLPGNQLTCPREFMVLEGGLKAKILGISLTGGYKYEATDNTYTGGLINLKSSIIDAGAEYTLFDKLTLAAGFKNVAYKGTEYSILYTSTTSSYQPIMSYDAVIMSYGAAAKFEFIKQASAEVSFTQTLFADNLNVSNNLGAQELDARVYLNF